MRQFRRALLHGKDRLKLPRERTPGYAEVATDLAAAVAGHDCHSLLAEIRQAYKSGTKGCPAHAAWA